jgi:hypothetical protein
VSRLVRRDDMSGMQCGSHKGAAVQLSSDQFRRLGARPHLQLRLHPRGKTGMLSETLEWRRLLHSQSVSPCPCGSPNEGRNCSFVWPTVRPSFHACFRTDFIDRRRANDTPYPFRASSRAIDLQGRRLCQGLMLCEEVHLQLATTAAVSTQPENCRFSEVETNSGTVTD